MVDEMQDKPDTAPLEQALERFTRRQPPLADHAAEPAKGVRLSSPAASALLRVDGVEAAALPPAGNEIRRIGMGPDCWMLVGETVDAAALRDSLGVLPEDAMITDLSHGWSRIRLQGPLAAGTLQHGIDLDLHPDAWPVGHSAATAYRTLPVLLHAPMPGCFDVYTLRSLAECLWEWLVDAAAGIDADDGDM